MKFYSHKTHATLACLGVLKLHYQISELAIYHFLKVFPAYLNPKQKQKCQQTTRETDHPQLLI